MNTLIILVFVIGYAAIAFEHNLNINKTATALLTGVLCWTLYIVGGTDSAAVHLINEHLSHHLSGISEILFFLLGAMTIVELVDAHKGFSVLTDRIKTQDIRSLLWIIGLVTFFLSSVLDNLTTAIVMVTLLRKLIQNTEQRKMFAGLVIIAANAGGAWCPIGDVTTTMLWIGGQISTIGITTKLILPSLACLVVPILYLSYFLKGSLSNDSAQLSLEMSGEEKPKGSLIMFFLGIGGLLFVPIFKTFTHLPPYMGMMLMLALIWIVSEFIHADKDEEEKKPFTVGNALARIDTSSVLFFLGILLAVAALESTELLKALAVQMDKTIGNQNLIVIAIGLASAIIDNVPLVAASMGMYDLQTFPMDHNIWEFLAYCAGTGGSILVIGSAAGVAVMGMERLDFMWYLRKITIPAALGYFAGVAIYLLM